MGIRHHLIALAGSVLVFSGAARACSEDAVALRGDWGSARFSVAVADEPAERSRGLMFVEKMPRTRGMLFVFEREGTVGFWMRNTLIPLDMIFADGRGVVQRVHVNAIPGDETVIQGGDNIRYVLEINGGLSEQMGIGPGTELRHPAISDPAWPCGSD